MWKIGQDSSRIFKIKLLFYKLLALLISISIFTDLKVVVLANNITSESSQLETESYVIYSAKYYEEFLESTKIWDIHDWFCVWFNFNNINELLKFLDVPFKNTKVKSFGNTRKKSAADAEERTIQESEQKQARPLLRRLCFAFQSVPAEQKIILKTPDEIKKELSELKTFELRLNLDIDKLICQYAESLSQKKVFSLLQDLCIHFSTTGSIDLAQIENIFPESITAQWVKKKLSILTSDSFWILLKSKVSPKKKLNIKDAISLLKSMLITLFFEKITKTFIMTLPETLETIKLSIDTNIPILFDFMNSMKHLSNLSNVELLGDYFEHSNQDFALFLSNLSNCRVLVLENPKFISHFFGLLNAEPNQPSENDPDKHFILESLEHLKLCLSYSDIFNIKELINIKKLSSLDILEFTNARQGILILRELKKFADSTFLSKIIISWPPSIDQFKIEIWKNESYDANYYACQLNTESILNPKIQECRSMIQKCRSKIQSFNSKTIENSSHAVTRNGWESSIELQKLEYLIGKLNFFNSLVNIDCIANIFDAMRVECFPTNSSNWSCDEFSIEEYLDRLENNIIKLAAEQPQNLISHIVEMISLLNTENNDQESKVKNQIHSTLLLQINEFINESQKNDE